MSFTLIPSVCCTHQYLRRVPCPGLCCSKFSSPSDEVPSVPPASIKTLSLTTALLSVMLHPALMPRLTLCPEYGSGYKSHMDRLQPQHLSPHGSPLGVSRDLLFLLQHWKAPKNPCQVSAFFPQKEMSNFSWPPQHGPSETASYR